MVEVGLARFRGLQQDAEIRDQLQQRWGLTLPLSAIGLLEGSAEHLLRGRNPHETREDIEGISKRLEVWRKRLQEQMSAEKDADKRSDQRTVLNYLGTYEHQLVGHVIPLEGSSEPLVVPRTNNLCEHRFGSTKRKLRRKVGSKKLTRYIQAMRPEVLLLPNLDDASYVDIVYGGNLENLASTFSACWSTVQTIRRERRQTKTSHPMPTTKQQLRRPQLLENVKQLVQATIEQLDRRQVA